VNFSTRSILAQRGVKKSTFPLPSSTAAVEQVIAPCYSAAMRIEMPFPSWADAAQRVQDDAHTLTLPAQRISLTDAWLALAPGEQILRIEVAAGERQTLTLTL